MRSGTYLSRTARLLEPVETQIIAFACASFTGRFGTLSMALLTIVRPFASSTNTATSLKPRSVASRMAALAISSAASSVSVGLPGISQRESSALPPLSLRRFDRGATRAAWQCMCICSSSSNLSAMRCSMLLVGKMRSSRVCKFYAAATLLRREEERVTTSSPMS